jgi:hypothetical protein
MMEKMFEERSFKNYNILRTMSRSRLNVVDRVHIGISTYNDKFRFNLYHRPTERRLENIHNLHRSPTFDLKIKPGTNQIENVEDFQTFINIFNTVINLSSTTLNVLYDDFLSELKLQGMGLYEESQKLANKLI